MSASPGNSALPGGPGLPAGVGCTFLFKPEALEHSPGLARSRAKCWGLPPSVRLSSPSGTGLGLPVSLAQAPFGSAAVCPGVALGNHKLRPSPFSPPPPRHEARGWERSGGAAAGLGVHKAGVGRGSRTLSQSGPRSTHSVLSSFQVLSDCGFTMVWRCGDGPEGLQEWTELVFFSAGPQEGSTGPGKG